MTSSTAPYTPPERDSAFTGTRTGPAGPQVRYVPGVSVALSPWRTPKSSPSRGGFLPATVRLLSGGDCVAAVDVLRAESAVSGHGPQVRPAAELPMLCWSAGMRLTCLTAACPC